MLVQDQLQDRARFAFTFLLYQYIGQLKLQLNVICMEFEIVSQEFESEVNLTDLRVGSADVGDEIAVARIDRGCGFEMFQRFIVLLLLPFQHAQVDSRLGEMGL